MSQKTRSKPKPTPGHSSRLQDLLWSQRLTLGVSRFMAVIMLTCLVVPMILVAERLAPAWRGIYLLPVVFLLTLESIYSHRKLKGVVFTEPEWWKYRLAEWVSILVMLKLLIYILRGFEQFWIDLPLWQAEFLRNFFNGEFLIVLILAVIIWLIAGQMEEMFQTLEGDESLLKIELDTGYSEQRLETRQRMANQVIGLGGLMVVIVALLGIESGLEWRMSPTVQLGVTAILIYFLASLVLLSLTQLAILRVRWIIYNVDIQRKIALRWFIFSFVLIFSLVLLAGILPTGYSGGILQIFQTIISWMIYAVMFLVQLIITPIILLFGWLFSLFQRKSGNIVPQQRLNFRPLPLFDPAVPLPWLEFLQKLFFWAFLIGIVVYAFTYYAKQNPEYFRWMAHFAPLRWAAGFWRWLRGGFSYLNRELTHAVQSGLERIRSGQRDMGGVSAGRSFNPKSLSPRQQAIYYYLVMLRRGGESGLVRQPSQTPHEYAAALEHQLAQAAQPDAETVQNTEQDSGLQYQLMEDISTLTGGFVEARYTQHSISPEQAGLIRRRWEHLRKIIEKWRTGSRQENKTRENK